MKVLYISLLSLAIIGQGTYFYYDFQGKKEQMLQTANMIGQVSNRVDEAEQAVANLKAAYFTEVNEAAKQNALKLEQVLDGRIAELQKLEAKQQADFKDRIADLQKEETVRQTFFEQHDANLRDLFAQTAEDNEQTRKATEDQTNHLLADIGKLRLDTLTRLSETESALAALKTHAGDKADRALKDKIRVQSAKLSNPEAH
jgi:hypothetical protein